MHALPALSLFRKCSQFERRTKIARPAEVERAPGKHLDAQRRWSTPRQAQETPRKPKEGRGKPRVAHGSPGRPREAQKHAQGAPEPRPERPRTPQEANRPTGSHWQGPGLRVFSIIHSRTTRMRIPPREGMPPRAFVGGSSVYSGSSLTARPTPRATVSVISARGFRV